MNTETQDRLEKSRKQRRNIRRVENRKGLNTSDYSTPRKVDGKFLPQFELDGGKYLYKSTLVNPLDKTATRKFKALDGYYDKTVTYGRGGTGEDGIARKGWEFLKNPLRQKYKDENLQIKSLKLKTKHFSRSVDYEPSGGFLGSNDILKSVDFRTSKENFIKEYEIDKDGNKIDRHIKFKGFYEKENRDDAERTFTKKSFLGDRILDSSEKKKGMFQDTKVEKNRIGYAKQTKLNWEGKEYRKEKQVFRSPFSSDRSAYTLDKQTKSDRIVKVKTFGTKYESKSDISNDKLRIDTSKTWRGLGKSVSIAEDTNEFGVYDKITTYSFGGLKFRRTKQLDKDQVLKIADKKSLIGRVKNFSMKLKVNHGKSLEQTGWANQHPWLAKVGRTALKIYSKARGLSALDDIVDFSKAGLGTPAAAAAGAAALGKEKIKSSIENSASSRPDIQTPMNEKKAPQRQDESENNTKSTKGADSQPVKYTLHPTAKEFMDRQEKDILKGLGKADKSDRSVPGAQKAKASTKLIKSKEDSEKDRGGIVKAIKENPATAIHAAKTAVTAGTLTMSAAGYLAQSETVRTAAGTAASFAKPLGEAVINSPYGRVAAGVVGIAGLAYGARSWWRGSPSKAANTNDRQQPERSRDRNAGVGVA